MSSKGERDCWNDQTRSSVWPNAAVRCPQSRTRNSQTMDSGLAEEGRQIGWIDVAAGAKWKVLRSLNVGSAAAEKVSAAAEKSAAAAEKRSAVAKRGDCGGKTQGLRSRSVKAAFSGLRPCGRKIGSSSRSPRKRADDCNQVCQQPKRRRPP